MEFDWLLLILNGVLNARIVLFGIILRREEMSELDAEICSLLEVTQCFIKQQARNEAGKNPTIYLKTQYKNSLKLIDSDKNIFEADESFLSAYRDVYTDKAYKAVRLNNWELELKFIGKRCVKIDLICESVTFLATKTIKRDIDGCHFKINIIQNEAEFKKFSPEVYGFLNRLGKRNIVAQSQNKNPEMKSLLSFAIKKASKPPTTFNFRPWSRNKDEIDPLQVLSQDGKKILDKLRHFITRQQVQAFMVEQQVSEQSVFELNKLLNKQ